MRLVTVVKEKKQGRPGRYKGGGWWEGWGDLTQRWILGEDAKGVGDVDVQGRSAPGRGYHRHKDPEVDPRVSEAGPLGQQLHKVGAGFPPYPPLCTQSHRASLEASLGARSGVRGLMKSKTVQGGWVARTWAFTERGMRRTTAGYFT